MAKNDFLFTAKYNPPKGPCLNCEDREVGCHGKCKAYIEWSTHRAEERDRINDEKQKRMEQVARIKDAVIRCSRRK